MEIKAIDRRHEGETVLRQCQLTQLYLLDVFKEICEEYDLQYFLIYGTLLGAMRHGGAIPWDDDLDVAMPKKDYKKFLKIAPKVLPEYLMLQTPKLVPGCFAYFSKIRDRRTFFLEETSAVQYPCGIYIDIFPFERIPKLPLPLRKLMAGAMSYSWRKSRKHRTLYHGTCFGVFFSAFMSLFFSTSHVMLRFFCESLSFVMPCDWGVCPETGCADSRIWFPQSMLFPLKRMRYEHGEYNVPNDSEGWLTCNFGDWRTPPPMSEQQGKHNLYINVEEPIFSRWSWPVGGWRE